MKPLIEYASKAKSDISYRSPVRSQDLIGSKLMNINKILTVTCLIGLTGISQAAPSIPSNIGESTHSEFNKISRSRLPAEILATTVDTDASTFDNTSIHCDGDCDDIDAVANVTDIEDIEDIDDSAILDDDVEDSENEVDSINLDVEHVPLNAISPETIEAFVEVIDVVRHNYLHQVNDEALFQHAITGMLEKLDSHAEYLSPENYENLRSFTDGEIGQVGITVDFDQSIGEWVVDSVASQSSAEKAGIKVGERLLRIKRADLTSDMQPQDIEQLLSGIAGSQVEITLSARNGVKRKVMLQRSLSTNNKLDVQVQDSIAIVRLPVFQNGAKDQLINALKATGVPITGVVLDVRNNPGGVLSSAIDILSLFIADKGLIQVRNRTNKSQIINPNGTPYLADLPVVVLQNRYSASAAEVLSSSLKSNKRAKVVGERSFGKGTVQEVIPLKSGGALKLTVAEYRSAQGELINGVGVEPDIIFAHDGMDWQQKAVDLLLLQERPLGIKFDELNSDSVINDY